MADSEISYHSQQTDHEPPSDGHAQLLFQQEISPPDINIHSEVVLPTVQNNTHRNRIAHNAGWEMNGQQDALSDMDYVEMDPALEEYMYAQSQVAGREMPMAGEDQAFDGQGEVMQYGSYDGNYDHDSAPGTLHFSCFIARLTTIVQSDHHT